MAFVVALPLLLVFLCALLDLGRTVFLRMALDDAAHAACRLACEQPGSADEARLVEAAQLAAPALAGANLHLKLDIRFGRAEDVSYVQHVYDDLSGAFVERPRTARARPVEVSLELRGSYLTPFGSLVAGGMQDPSFDMAARARGFADETIKERGR